MMLKDLLRIASVALALVPIAGLITSAGGQERNSYCDLLVAKTGEEISGSRTSQQCLVISRGGADVTFEVHRFANPDEACDAVDQLRQFVLRTPNTTVADWIPEPGRATRGFESRSAQTGNQSASDHKPAFYAAAFCSGRFRFYAHSSHVGGVGTVVPESIVEDIRARARTSSERIGGDVATRVTKEDDEAALLESISGGRELARLTEPFLEGGLAQLLRRGEFVLAVDRQLLQRAGNLPGDNPVRRTLQFAAQFAQAVDINGEAAFPALRASLPLMMNLAVTAGTSQDPVAAHLALTALARYSMMLVRMDAQSLVERFKGKVPQ